MSEKGAGAPSPEAILDRETRALVRLSAALATRDEERIREALEGAREDADPVPVEEVLLQSHLFLGFPAALRALSLWRRIAGRPPPTEEETDAGGEQPPPRGRGERLCRLVYGDQYEPLRRNIRSLHPAMDRWMLERGYGEVLSRDGLDPKRRELAIAALLAVEGTGVQLHSHLRGALRVGAGPTEVEAVLRLVEAYQGDAERETTRMTWERVRRGRERR